MPTVCKRTAGLALVLLAAPVLLGALYYRASGTGSFPEVQKLEAPMQGAPAPHDAQERYATATELSDVWNRVNELASTAASKADVAEMRAQVQTLRHVLDELVPKGKTGSVTTGSIKRNGK